MQVDWTWPIFIAGIIAIIFVWTFVDRWAHRPPNKAKGTKTAVDWVVLITVIMLLVLVAAIIRRYVLKF